MLLLVFLASCTRDRARSDGDLTSRDSAGITIIDRAGESRGLRAPWRLSGEPTLEIGVVSGEPAYQFTEIHAAVRLSDGRIVVTDGESVDVRYFDEEGRHLRTVGGLGDGPEEYRSGPVYFLALPGDSLLVQDGSDRIWYDAQGRFVRRVGTPLQELREALPDDAGRAGGVWLSDYRLVSELDEPLIDRTPGPPFRLMETFVMLPAGWSRVDTLYRAGGSRQQIVGLDAIGFWGVYPYHITNMWDWSMDGRWLAFGDGAVAEVRRIDEDGATTIIRWDEPRQSVSPDEVDRWMSWFLDQQPADRRPLARRGIAAADMPDLKPVMVWLRIARDGSVWMASGDPRFSNWYDVDWKVIDENGRFLGAIELPDRFVPLDIGEDYVLGSWRDEFDVPFVRMYELIR